MAEIIDLPEPFTRPLDAMGRPIISDADKARIDSLWATIPEGRRGAVLVIVDETGEARGHIAAKINDHWKVGAGGGWKFGEKKPKGFIGREGSW